MAHNWSCLTITEGKFFVYVSLVSDGNASEEDKADDLTNEDQICLCCAKLKKVITSCILCHLKHLERKLVLLE